MWSASNVKNLEAIQQEPTLNLMDEQKMYDIGVELEKKLVVSCPKFVDYSQAKENS